jgi:hypothetical protein
LDIPDKLQVGLSEEHKQTPVVKVETAEIETSTDDLIDFTNSNI